MSKQRLDFLDATKGVAILCIVLLHIEDGVFPAWLNTWIGLFMITTFYFISGCIMYVKKQTSSGRMFFLKRFNQLGIPYISFSLLILLFELIWITLGFMTPEVLYRDIYKTITLRGIGTLWFLPVLLLAEMFFLFIRTYKNRWGYLLFFFILTLLLPYLYNTYWLAKLDNNVYFKLIDSPIRPFIQALTAWPIIAVGYFFAKYVFLLLSTLQSATKILIGLSILIFSLLFVAVPPFEILFVNVYLSNILPAIGLILFFCGLKKILSFYFLVYWGKNSLILMATHYSITEVLIRSFDRYILGNESCTGFITLFYFILIVLLTYPWVYLFNNHLRFVLSRK